MAQNVAVQRGFLDPPAAADLNTRNLSALYEVVDGRERNPQVLGRLFYGKEMVNRTVGHSLGENSVVIVSDHKIGFYPANLRVFEKSGARVVAMPFQSVRFLANASTPVPPRLASPNGVAFSKSLYGECKHSSGSTVLLLRMTPSASHVQRRCKCKKQQKLMGKSLSFDSRKSAFGEAARRSLETCSAGRAGAHPSYGGCQAWIVGAAVISFFKCDGVAIFAVMRKVFICLNALRRELAD